MNKKTPQKPAKKKAAPKIKLAGNAKHVKVGGLGKGLDALLTSQSAATAAARHVPAIDIPAAKPPQAGMPAAAAVAAELGKPLSVKITMIKASPWQPRSTFDEEALKELSESMRAHGVIQPLICRKLAADQYELIAGERRLRAAGLAGLESVPVVLIKADDRAAAEMTLIENLQREDLNPIEEAEGYQALAEAFNLTQQEISDRVGKARASVANAMRMLDLSDEIRSLISKGLIAAGHAKLLLSVEDDATRIRLAADAARGGWTVKELERSIKRLSAQKAVKTAVADIPAHYLRSLIDALSQRLGAKVQVFPSMQYANGRHGNGKIVVDFSGNEELNRLLEIMGLNMDEGI